MWVLPALKQIREICCLYQEAPHNTAPSTHHTQRQGMYSRVPNKRTGRLLEDGKKSHLYALIQD